MLNKLSQRMRPAWQKSLNFYPIIAARLISAKPTYQLMSPLNLAMVNKWAVEEGWNLGKHEKKSFLAADPKGFWLSKVWNMPIASLAAVRYKKLDKPFFAWLGLYIVQSDYRHRGYGKGLWDHAKNQLKNENYEPFGLHAVMNQIETYQKDGFEVRYDKAINTRWVTITDNEKFKCRKSKIEIISLKNVFKEKPNVCMSDVMQYDARIFSTSRSNFLKEWFQMKQAKVFIVFDGDNINGYGVLSVTADGYKIAPLFAKNAHIAEDIFIKCLCAVPNSSRIFVDTTGINESSIDIVKKLGFRETFQTCTMYTANGRLPNLKQEEIFAMTSLEISP